MKRRGAKKKGPLQGRLPIMQLMFLLMFFFAICEFVLYQELDSEVPNQASGMQRVMFKIKVIHRKLAYFLRRGIFEIKYSSRTLEKSCKAECVLPLPSILRTKPLPQYDTALAPSTVEPLVNMTQFIESVSKNKPAPAHTQADQKQNDPPVEVTNAKPISNSILDIRKREKGKVPTGAQSAVEETVKKEPYKMSMRIRNEMHDKQRIDQLLHEKVDIVLNQLLLEMRGGISCGGKAIMEFKDMDAILATHPQIKEILPEYDDIGSQNFGKCAVVGNSGNLLNSSLGEQIDSYDTVIRFNAAPTRNYEKDVGAKTTVRIQNVDNLGFHESGDKYLIYTARTKRDVAKFVNHRKKYRKRKQYTFNAEFWCHVWDWVAHRKLKPSTGIAGVVLALKTCEAPVDLFGFSHNATDFHYFNHLPKKVTEEDVYKFHPLLEEAEIYKELEGEGLARVML